MSRRRRRRCRCGAIVALVALVALAADLHPRDALIPSLDHAASSELERERLVVFPRAVELLAVRECSHVVHLDRVTGLRLGALADREVLDAELLVAGRRRGLGGL